MLLHYKQIKLLSYEEKVLFDGACGIADGIL